MRIDHATMEDVDRVVELWIDLAAEQRRYGSHLRAAANEEPIRTVLSHHVVDDGLLVAREDGDVVGFVSFEVETGGFARSATRGIVQNVYVEPGARDEGIGSALLEEAEADMADRGVDVVSLETMADNDAARRLYERRGYRPYRIEYERPVESDTHSSERG